MNLTELGNIAKKVEFSEGFAYLLYKEWEIDAETIAKLQTLQVSADDEGIWLKFLV